MTVPVEYRFVRFCRVRFGLTNGVVSLSLTLSEGEGNVVGT